MDQDQRPSNVEAESGAGPSLEITGQSTVVNNYRYFRALSKEMADLARKEAERSDGPSNEYRYSIASVIFSYSYIEVYFNYIWHAPQSQIRQMFKGMSRDLRRRLHGAALAERIEYVVLHYPGSQASSLNRGEEPVKSRFCRSIC